MFETHWVIPTIFFLISLSAVYWVKMATENFEKVKLVCVSLLALLMGAVCLLGTNKGRPSRELLEPGEVYQALQPVTPLPANGYIVTLRDRTGELRVYHLFENPPEVFTVVSSEVGGRRYLPYGGPFPLAQ